MFKTNEYFDGKVKSIAFASAEGPATVGVMAAGEYEFGTSTKEIMQVVSGTMDVKLPGTDTWKTMKPGAKFEVQKDSKFGVKTTTDTSYLCLYK
jgi:hypothetical protein